MGVSLMQSFTIGVINHPVKEGRDNPTPISSPPPPRQTKRESPFNLTKNQIADKIKPQNRKKEIVDYPHKQPDWEAFIRPIAATRASNLKIPTT